MSIEAHWISIHFKCSLQVIATKNNPENTTDAISCSFISHNCKLFGGAPHSAGHCSPSASV